MHAPLSAFYLVYDRRIHISRRVQTTSLIVRTTSLCSKKRDFWSVSCSWICLFYHNYTAWNISEEFDVWMLLSQAVQWSRIYSSRKNGDLAAELFFMSNRKLLQNISTSKPPSCSSDRADIKEEKIEVEQKPKDNILRVQVCCSLMFAKRFFWNKIFFKLF